MRLASFAASSRRGDLLRRSELGTEARRPQWQEFFTGSGKLAEEFVRSHGRKVGEVMSPEPITIASGAPLDEAVALMLDRKIKRLPVIADGKLVGVIARSDLVRTLIDTLPDGSAAVSSDDQIRAALAEALRGQGWAAMDHMRAEVAGGVVTLEGTILDERQRVALKVVAENTPGVKQVIDHMVWIEPMSGLVLRSPEDRQPGDDDADNKAA